MYADPKRNTASVGDDLILKQEPIIWREMYDRNSVLAASHNQKEGERINIFLSTMPYFRQQWFQRLKIKKERKTK